MTDAIRIAVLTVPCLLLPGCKPPPSLPAGLAVELGTPSYIYTTSKPSNDVIVPSPNHSSGMELDHYDVLGTIVYGDIEDSYVLPKEHEFFILDAATLRVSFYPDKQAWIDALASNGIAVDGDDWRWR